MNTQLTDVASNLFQLQNVSVQAAQSASSFVLTLFAIVYLTTKKGCYFAAFLLDLFLSNSIMLNFLTQSQYYVMSVFIYSLLYWYVVDKKVKIETIISIGVLILFNLWMSFDAIINEQNKSFIYNNHTGITVLIYVLLFSTLFPWQKLRLGVDRFVRAVSDIIRYSDVVAYVWYNCKKKSI